LPPANIHLRIFMRTITSSGATVDMRSCEIIEGNIPRKQTRLILAWAELHQEELMANWRLVINGEEPFKIKPLE